MTGISLSPRIFTESKHTPVDKKLIQEFGNVQKLLRFLRGLGVTHIELRSVGMGDDPEDILNIASLLWNNGFEITVHASLPCEVSRFSESWPNLIPFLNKAKSEGKTTVITVHSATSGNDSDKSPAANKTNEILKLWSKEAKDLGIKIALEINRDKLNGDPSVTCKGVLEMLEETDPEFIGICFDFGHYYSNVKQKGEDMIPDEEFLRRVIHTHIHALENGKTHFPLGSGAELPLELYASSLLKVGYCDVFNFEPDFPRYGDRSFRDAIRTSISEIYAAQTSSNPFSASARKDYAAAIDNRYSSELARIAKEIKAEQGNAFWTLCPSGQFFCIDGVKFAVDPAFRSKNARNSALTNMRSVLEQADFILITHEHDDHFDLELARSLCDLPCTWIFGENFSPALIEKANLKKENVLSLPFEKKRTFFNAEISAFNGSHFSPDGTGVDSSMFFLTINSKKLFFPADVRDYGADKMPLIPPPDLMFANVWLGRGCAVNTPPAAYEEFCNYISFFSPKKVFLGHLYEYTRSNSDMWRYEHAGRIMDILLCKLPSVPVIPLRPFSKYEI